MTDFDRLRDAVLSLIRSADPHREYRGIYEYTVVLSTPGASAGGTTTPAVAALRSSNPTMPELVGVPVPMPVSFAGTGALAMVLAPGAKVYVAFADGDPAKPFVVQHVVST